MTPSRTAGIATIARIAVLLLLPVSLAGCVSISSSDPNPPQSSTVVTPAGSATTICNPGPC